MTNAPSPLSPYSPTGNLRRIITDTDTDEFASLTKLLSLDEYDFLPVKEPKHNRSPLVLQEHKLGLEAWSVKILFQYAYNRLFAWRNNESQSKFIDPQELQSLSRAVVLVNPECSTAWNIRKELVDNGDLSVSDDLRLGALVLSKHPKSPETFSHSLIDQKKTHLVIVHCTIVVFHRVLVAIIVQGVGQFTRTFVNMDAIDINVEAGLHNLPENRQGLNIPAMQNSFHEHMQRELTVCKCAAEKYSCNYNAWSHRIWVMQNCFNCSVQVLLAELQSTEVWVKKHVSDHSGFHYRQFLLSTIQQSADCLMEQFSMNHRNLLQKEMNLLIDLIKTCPGHEALWYHRKYVFHAMCKSCDPAAVIEISDSTKDEKDMSSTNCQKRTKLENEKQVMLLKEIDLVTKYDLSSKDKWHCGIAQKYLDWIQKCCRA
ncbi:hypothetical protein FSP39_000644 [Pinctada imbricata]|uniref:Protein prenyltransferase alpha subunit repeat-containing protein 1 n=1 Tax=Pinctada imbricata TaxID=66713 RepID=A0AA88Y1Y3_PINIB|nr:hypothetical protein FSP39_000644 [Pinctada imbricata]